MLEERISCWIKMRRTLTYVKKHICRLRSKIKGKNSSNNADQEYPSVLNVEEIQDAETIIIKLHQRSYFKDEISILIRMRHGEKVSLQSSGKISNLDPFIDENEVVHVGGRIKRSNLNTEYIHPILLFGKGIVTNLLVKWYHQSVGHGGRGYTLNRIRSSGYWIVKANSVVQSFIARCVRCQYLHGKIAEQKMADLTEDRISTEPPFTYVGLDMFRPFTVKQYRKEMKQYGIIFTCLSSCTMHLEVVQNMETDSFIQALRFIAHRGSIRLIRCDNGNNFVGAKSELQRSLSEMDEDKISHFLQNGGTDWVTWKNNPPSGSHMGGVWEHQIKSACVILSALLKQHGTSLNNKSLIKVLTEVESIVNSRPLTVETLGDVAAFQLVVRNSRITNRF